LLKESAISFVLFSYENCDFEIIIIFSLLVFIAVDITVYHGGFHGDLNETFFVGNVNNESIQLVSVTHECLMQAIDSGELPYALWEGCGLVNATHKCLMQAIDLGELPYALWEGCGLVKVTHECCSEGYGLVSSNIIVK